MDAAREAQAVVRDEALARVIETFRAWVDEPENHALRWQLEDALEALRVANRVDRRRLRTELVADLGDLLDLQRREET